MREKEEAKRRQKELITIERKAKEQAANSKAPANHKSNRSQYQEELRQQFEQIMRTAKRLTAFP